jgi:pimeloyl-ACP methyl ester carboxylesterase
LPAIRIGDGPRTLVSLPGLSLDERHPTGQARTMALTGWEPLLDRYTIHRIGRRTYPVGTTFREMADDVITAIEGLRPPVDLMGTSTGGIIALELAAARPDLVHRLVLAISGTTASPFARDLGERVIHAARAGQWRRAYAMFLPIGARSGPERLFYRAFGWLLGPGLVGTPDDPTLMIAELEAWLRTDDRALVGRVNRPTLVLAGELDPVFPLEDAREFAAGFSDGRLVVMPRTAHDFPASAIRDHVSDFLDEGPGSWGPSRPGRGVGQPVTGATPASEARPPGPAPASGPSRSGGRGRP